MTKDIRTIKYPYDDSLLITDEHFATRADSYLNSIFNYTTYVFDVHGTWYFEINKGYTNSNKMWQVHIDNEDRKSVASFDVSTIQEFNDFMVALRIPYRMTTNEIITNDDSLEIYHWKMDTTKNGIYVTDLRTNDHIGVLQSQLGLHQIFVEKLIYMTEQQLFEYLESNLEFF